MRISGRVGWACGENMMSGTILIEKNAGSQFGAAIRGGDLVCKGEVGSRTGIDMKGGTIIVGGDTGAFTGFMMQRGRMVICGNAGKNLGDSMYDGTIYLGGEPASLGVDAVWAEMTDLDRKWLSASSANTTSCPSPASAISARSSPASNCGTTTISSRARRRWCCDEEGQTRQRRQGPGRGETLHPRQSQIFTPEVINDIHIKSELGRYRMRGFSLFKKIPHWDDLTFLPGTLTRFVIEGYREKCETKTVIGPRAKRPMALDIPVYVTGMSFGALSYEAKIALARGATMAGSATCSGEGGMIPDERRYSIKWFYQCIQSRYGFNPHHLRLADACEFFIGQGCKVGLGGHLMGQKVTDQVAEMRSLPAGIDQRSPARHPDWLGPDDLALKIQEMREATNWEIPIQLKLGAARVYDDVRMAVKCGPDSIYIDAMEGGTGAGPHIATEDTGVPGIAAIREARRAIDELGKKGEISLVYAGGIRNGGDVAKALALGADAIAIGHSVLMALNCNKHIDGVTISQRDRRRGRLLLSLPYRPLPGRRRHAGSGASPAPRSRQGGRARLQFPPHADDGGADAGARLRQDEHPFARAGGSGGADHGSVRHVQGAARRHQLHRRRRRNYHKSDAEACDGQERPELQEATKDQDRVDSSSRTRPASTPRARRRSASTSAIAMM